MKNKKANRKGKAILIGALIFDVNGFLNANIPNTEPTCKLARHKDKIP